MKGNVSIQKFAIGAGIVAISYLMIWFVTYSVVMDFDYGHVMEYLLLGWSGGGEVQSTIQLVSLLATALATVVALAIARITRKRRGISKDSTP